jgi:citrate lyase subunit beta/citryl-CoA lyase
VIPACEHFAGSEKLIVKALELQAKMGRVFDITCDCEDGAQAGKEREHAEMIVEVLTSSRNTFGMAGARIHDYTHPHWKKDVDILVGGAGKVLAYLTLPKSTATSQVAEMIAYIEAAARRPARSARSRCTSSSRPTARCATPGTSRGLKTVQVLDFGLMDFVSGHHGAIAASNMRSPGQFEHPLVVRAKAESSAARSRTAWCRRTTSRSTSRARTTCSATPGARATTSASCACGASIPSQIQPIVDAMKPDLGEVADASEILLAAQRANWGPIQYQGELHDRATYRYFWELLQKAQVTGVALARRAARAFFAEQADDQCRQYART